LEFGGYLLLLVRGEAAYHGIGAVEADLEHVLHLISSLGVFYRAWGQWLTESGAASRTRDCAAARALGVWLPGSAATGFLASREEDDANAVRRRLGRDLLADARRRSDPHRGTAPRTRAAAACRGGWQQRSGLDGHRHSLQDWTD